MASPNVGTGANPRPVDEYMGEQAVNPLMPAQGLYNPQAQTVGANEIVTTGNQNLSLNPAGTGKVRIKNTYLLPDADGSANQVIKTDGAGNLSFSTLATTIQLRDQDSSQHDYTFGGDLQFLCYIGISTSITGNVITHSIGSLTGVTIDTSANTITDAGTNASGHGLFEYDVPTGFYALCTKNIITYG